MARVTETKVCNRCQEEKSIDEFTPHKGGYYSRCRSCAAADMRASRARKTPEQRAAEARRWGLKRMYGISEEDYEMLYELQNGQCAICGKEPESRRLDVDHDHRTGAVRGLLCSECNRGVGLLGDDHERLMNAAIYVTRSMDVINHG